MLLCLARKNLQILVISDYQQDKFHAQLSWTWKNITSGHDRFSAILYKEVKFCNLLFAYCTPSPFRKGVYFKRKEFAPVCGEKCYLLELK